MGKLISCDIPVSCRITHNVKKIANKWLNQKKTNQLSTCFAVSTGLFVVKEDLMYSLLLPLHYALVTNYPSTPSPYPPAFLQSQQLSLSEGAGSSYWMLCATPVRSGALSSEVIKVSSSSLSSPAIHPAFGLLVCLLSALKRVMFSVVLC